MPLIAARHEMREWGCRSRWVHIQNHSNSTWKRRGKLIMRTNRPLEPGPPPPFFVKWNPSPHRVNGKKNTPAEPTGGGAGTMGSSGLCRPKGSEDWAGYGVTLDNSTFTCSFIYSFIWQMFTGLQFCARLWAGYGNKTVFETDNSVLIQSDTCPFNNVAWNWAGPLIGRLFSRNILEMCLEICTNLKKKTFSFL